MESSLLWEYEGSMAGHISPLEFWTGLALLDSKDTTWVRNNHCCMGKHHVGLTVLWTRSSSIQFHRKLDRSR